MPKLWELTINYPFESTAYDRQIIKSFQIKYDAIITPTRLVPDYGQLRTLTFIFPRKPCPTLLDALNLQTEECEDFSYTVLEKYTDTRKL